MFLICVLWHGLLIMFLLAKKRFLMRVNNLSHSFIFSTLIHAHREKKDFWIFWPINRVCYDFQNKYCCFSPNNNLKNFSFPVSHTCPVLSLNFEIFLSNYKLTSYICRLVPYLLLYKSISCTSWAPFWTQNWYLFKNLAFLCKFLHWEIKFISNGFL